MRCLYNKEVVVDWRTVQSGREAQTAFQDAIKLLKDSELQNREVILSVALKRLVGYRTFDGAPDPKRVPIKDFYKEVRTELLRRQLDRKGALGKPISNDLPLWVFLYNLDRQLRCSAEEGGPALFVETGSQAEHAKGWALTLNGLDARNDYKQYCFVKPTR